MGREERLAPCQIPAILMARFDVYRLSDSDYVVDCQADLLSLLKTRFVVPLIPADSGPPPIPKLNPRFELEGQYFYFYVDLASAIPVRDLGSKIASLADYDSVILGALDMLISGV